MRRMRPRLFAILPSTNRRFVQYGGGRDNDSLVIGTATVWVEYSDDFSDRSVVDFDSGSVAVEAALDLASDPETVSAVLEKAVRRLLSSRGSTCPWSSSVEVHKPLTNSPILDNIIDLSPFGISADSDLLAAEPAQRTVRPRPAAPTARGADIARRGSKPVAAGPASERRPVHSDSSLSKWQEDAAALAQQRKEEVARIIVAQSTITVSPAVGGDGTERYVARIEMNLVADNLSKSAALYRDIVRKYSDKYQIEQPLIFAIIEQESRFNPQAVSWVPAYGLMQLVPSSGGADAYRYAFGKDVVPTRSFLFDPDNNINLGTAYLRILFNQFGRVTDAGCRRLCVIASYNTGAGNVSRSFIGSNQLTKAFDSINVLDYNQLYIHLTTRLGADEARKYVSGVTSRREKYLSHVKHE